MDIHQHEWILLITDINGYEWEVKGTICMNMYVLSHSTNIRLRGYRYDLLIEICIQIVSFVVIVSLGVWEFHEMGGVTRLFGEYHGYFLGYMV